MREVFANYLLEVLVNAAKIDGFANDPEREAIAAAMTEARDEEFTRAQVDQAIDAATLSREELTAYLDKRGGVFSAEQKMLLLNSLLSVIAADGVFDQREKDVLHSYIEILGVDPRRSSGMFEALVAPFRNAV